MFVKVHPPLKVTGGDNKGSSKTLINYLSKENEGKEKDEFNDFFNQEKEDICKQKATAILDSNNQRLTDKDTKFYMLSINPSWRELEHLETKISTELNQPFDKTNPQHIPKMEGYLKDYTNDMMQVYAANFKRLDSKDNPIQVSSKDLNYVAKIEYNRSFKHWEKEVKHNTSVKKEIRSIEKKQESTKNVLKLNSYKRQLAKLDKTLYRQNDEGIIKQGIEGSLVKTDGIKQGRNTHIHVVVSRQTKSKWYKGEKVVDENGKALTQDKEALNQGKGMKLSPNANSKGDSDKQVLNGKKVKNGFNHEKFKKEAGKLFQEKFNYIAQSKEQYTPITKDAVSKFVNKARSKTQSLTKQQVNKHLRGEVGKVEEKLMKSMLKPKQMASQLIKEKLAEIKQASIKEVLKGNI